MRRVRRWWLTDAEINSAYLEFWRKRGISDPPGTDWAGVCPSAPDLGENIEISIAL